MCRRITSIAVIVMVAACIFLATSVSAAELVIKLKSGETRIIPLADIESISFTGEGAGNVDIGLPADSPLDTLLELKKIVLAGDYDEIFQYIGEKDASGFMTDEHVEKYGEEVIGNLTEYLGGDTIFGKLEKEREHEGEWNIIPVTYSKDGAEKTVYFAFMKVAGKWLLCDID